jgi:hypothetical protein
MNATPSLLMALGATTCKMEPLYGIYVSQHRAKQKKFTYQPLQQVAGDKDDHDLPPKQGNTTCQKLDMREVAAHEGDPELSRALAQSSIRAKKHQQR